MNWFHRLIFNSKVCETCEVLKQQLAYSQQQNQYLLNKLINPIKLDESEKVQNEEIKPLVPKYIPWTVKRQMLEEEDRAKAKVIREHMERERELKQNSVKVQEDIKNLENELGVESDASQISETI